MIAPAWWRLEIELAEPASTVQPGQFFLVRCGTDHPVCYLRRPVFPAQVGARALRLLLTPDPDPGFAWLIARKPGDGLDVLGPFGNGFPNPDQVRNILLVSDGQTLGPLLGQMTQALETGLALTLALGGSRASALYPPTLLPPVIEYHAATLDGSLGHRGPVTEVVPPLLRWADVVYATGSNLLYRSLKVQSQDIRLGADHDFLYGLITTHSLACGLGACLGCALETKAGIKLACVDGPVFDLTTLEL